MKAYIFVVMRIKKVLRIYPLMHLVKKRNAVISKLDYSEITNFKGVLFTIKMYTNSALDPASTVHSVHRKIK